MSYREPNRRLVMLVLVLIALAGCGFNTLPAGAAQAGAKQPVQTLPDFVSLAEKLGPVVVNARL